MKPESAESYYARVAAATDDDGRLPVVDGSAMTWDIFPFEAAGLRLKPLQPMADTEPPRRGEDPATCWCATPGAERPGTIWRNDRWVLRLVEPSSLPLTLFLEPVAHHDLTGLTSELAAELGQLVVSVSGALEALPSVGRAHVAKYGDGAAHLHMFLFGRPARVPQLRGSPLQDWSECLPPVPADVLHANAAYVAGRVAVDMGGETVAPTAGS
ncbi:hypothetical protein ET495_13550 [Xylanimonas allomyrinae]|uniref:HIT domain-containing protein n=1 Tax=Xylanimonas allomyrinae TaxID=2509459 RepID=A0A4P6ENK1_9MICO|nr:hypothetical protein [Xylanimonas allomyrinae]QAY64075.1 hypothetical protein ET495_13550 [Xylanimonas allomyrinae]